MRPDSRSIVMFKYMSHYEKLHFILALNFDALDICNLILHDHFLVKLLKTIEQEYFWCTIFFLKVGRGSAFCYQPL